MCFHLLKHINDINVMSIGIGEIIIILIVAVVFVGPDNLPKFAKTIGKTIHKYKTVIKDAKKEMDIEIDKY